ncbi:MAG TPA: bifunctional glutamate N-acetyltransferase/amino-acid acetyltransferase ArgJ [Roseiflexaceae bacterium]|nr:bifunctional glutamate N-acetyltransferase/amino-acid acetyltransferase ArgJ [Roseiflexaceae bacterium]
MTDRIDSFQLAPGFRASAVACGLKTSSAMAASALDLALVAAEGPCSAAGMFTTNRVKAAPVLYDQEVLAQSAGHIRAVIANAGCANACTGSRGMADARRMAELTAYALRCQPDEVLVLSTGVIGRHLDMEKVTRGIAEVSSPVAERGAGAAARAIMTTDTRPKVATRTLTLDGRTVTISGFCKGAGMIHPNMATMLAVVTTDAVLAPETLHTALRAAAERSFNRISVDGDTSTNDTLLLLASGASGIEPTGDDLRAFTAALTDLCIDLAKQIARDGEGATRLIEIHVTGARDEGQAHTVANSIARSPLVKTAIHGGDPNWGRILAAAGYSGAAIDPDKLLLSFGPQAEPLLVVSAGLPVAHDEREASALFRADPVFIRLDLGLGDAAATVWTCDFSAEYVAINAHYTT